MWLSIDETNTLDNALITMEHLFKTGTVHIYLQRLINEKSHLEIHYYIEKLQNKINHEQQLDEQTQQQEGQMANEPEKIKLTLSMADIDDHKRQLTFCNVDLHNMPHKKILLNEQLKILNIIEKINSVLLELEISGHPEYQLRSEKYDIYDRTGEFETNYYPFQ
ncbi:unnamed protein product [Didymodactylos carnosus]|uniref:Uncharacterized protein n=1 Tax=Didymodactylos carnosus TaxID=1234261 RepID=A0A8S2HSU4_9BILA|nr:unnamed protein product [Didymodactylos carnosus]CAF3674426.1 unnamed protein product [Didymodactylos carnosus]